MSRRQSKPAKSKTAKKKSPKPFNALRGLFSGYLHQDFRDVYGSAAAAAEAFCQDASKEEVALARSEWNEWRAQMGHHSVERIQRAVRALGAAWHPESTGDLDRVGEVLARGDS